jgi:hypothetical protein
LVKSRPTGFAYFSPVTTVKSVSAAVVVEVVDAGCAMTIVVPGPTTVSA